MKKYPALSAADLQLPRDTPYALQDLITFVHQGVVLLFARPAGPVTDLMYNVLLDVNAATADGSAWSGWRAIPLAEPAGDTPIPSSDTQPMLRVSGADLLTVPAAMTAAVPADAPFQVVSGSDYICVFRLSTRSTLLIDRFALIQTLDTTTHPSGSTAAPDWTLQRAWEVRYKRSRQRDIGSGPSDTLDSQDMLSKPFLEPTTELCGLPSLSPGQFTVLLSPTGTPGVSRWNIACAAGQSVTLISYAQDETGRVQPGDSQQFSVDLKLEDQTTLTVAGPPALTVFEETEETPLADTTFQAKRATKVMLAVPVSDAGSGLSSALAVFDFLVQTDGTLPPWPGNPLPLIDGTLSDGQFQPTVATSYPVPDTAVQNAGTAAVSGYVLGQVTPSAGPVLVDGSDGLVHCYFASACGTEGDGEFAVAQFSPLVCRARYTLPWQANSQSGLVTFVTERSGTSMNGIELVCGNDPAGNLFRSLTVSYGAQTGIPGENWRALPADVSGFTAVLNGNASSSVNDPDVQNGTLPFYDYTGTLTQLCLPVDSMNSGSDHTTLVSVRSDLPFSSATLTASDNNTLTLTLSFSTASGASLTQTWPNLPAACAQMLAVLEGGVSPETYNYVAPATDTAFYALTSDSGTLLLCFDAGTNASLSVSASTKGPAFCNLAVNTDVTQVERSDIPRDQTAIAAVLMTAGITSLLAASPDLSAGPLSDQSVETPLDNHLGSLLFGIYAPDMSGTVSPAAGLIPMRQGHTLTAGTPEINGLTALTAFSGSLPQFGQSGFVAAGTASSSLTAANGSWQAAADTRALILDGTESMSVDLSAASARTLVPARSMTLESWINPVISNPLAIVACQNALYQPPSPGGVLPEYLLTTTGLPVLYFTPVTEYVGITGPYVELPPSNYFDLYGQGPKAFTWEAWICPETLSPYSSTTLGLILECQDSGNTNQDIPQFMLGLNGAGNLVFGYRTGTDEYIPVSATQQTTAIVQPGEWTHVAVTGSQASDSTWTFCLYINGRQELNTSGTALWTQSIGGLVYFGASDTSNISLCGSIADIRFWQDARSPLAIRRGMTGRLTGTEPALLGCWPLAQHASGGNPCANICVAGYTGSGEPRNQDNGNQKLQFIDDGTFVDIQASVGGLPLYQCDAFLRTLAWNHVALVFSSGSALSLNPAGFSDRLDYGQLGSAFSVDGDAGSIDLWMVASASVTAQTLLSCWGAESTNQAFQLEITAQGYAAFTFSVNADTAVATVTATGQQNLIDGNPHHIAASWQNVQSQNDNTKLVLQVNLYVDGSLVQSVTSDTPADVITPLQSQAPLTFGISALDAQQMETQSPLSGMLAAVRIWSECLSLSQVQAAMSQGRAFTGGALMASWWFDETEGNVASDTTGELDIILTSNDLWSVFLPTSTLGIFANGIPLPSSVYGPPPEIAQGFSLGGATGNYGAMQGQVQEFRIWSTARSQQQLMQSLFHPLGGSETGLVGYWPLNNSLVDATGYGNNGSTGTALQYAVSSAPVANEGPAVRNIYGGLVTAFQDSLKGAPAVAEFGRLIQGQQSTAISAAMSRAYLYSSGGALINLDTRYGLGDLDMIYLGQIQSQPTLTGYIEGAPPVPSENLTRPLYTSALGYNGYADSSVISLIQNEATSITFLSSDRKIPLIFDGALNLGLMFEKKIDVATPVILQNLCVSKGKIGAAFKGHFETAHETGTSYASGWTQASSVKVGLRGTWENSAEQNYINPQIGRRYQPVNDGVAVVESLVADLFALTMPSTGAMVGKVALPDLSQGPQRNILTFRMNPGYVKNGTLDGKIGFANDPSYPGADFQRGSYYKPEEAGLLRKKISSEEAALQAGFDQFSESQGEALNADISSAAAQQFFAPNTRSPRRGLVNDYVWDARVGLIKNEAQFQSSWDRKFTGSGKWTFMGGLHIESEFAFSVGVYGGLDALFGTGAEVSVTRDEVTSQVLGLTADVTGEPFLLSFTGAATNDGYSALPAPGKVLGYRFSSFYLPPDPQNGSTLMSQVIDPVWLQNSDDPNAIALRGVNFATQSPWRVLHRVSYVSRVPPGPDASPQQNGQAALDLAFDIGDNMLINQLVASALPSGPFTPLTIGSALQKVLIASADTASPLGAIVPWWDNFVITASGSQSPDATAMLLNIQQSLMRYLLNGYETGVLPLQPVISLGKKSQQNSPFPALT